MTGLYSSGAELAALLGELTPDERAAVIGELDDASALALLYDWRGMWARPEQLPPAAAHRTWLIQAGRGFGKTRTGAETVREWTADPDAVIALIGPTSADVRDVMVGGESGLLKVFPPAEQPLYQPSKRRVVFASGAVAYCYSAEEPERLRGPQHSGAWLDELAVYPALKELWDNLQFGLRLGAEPHIIATTTPRPLPWLKQLAADPMTIVTRGATRDNAANLPASTLAEFDRIYGGTRIGRQELLGELLDEADGALWTREAIERGRVREHPELVRIVIAIDPSVTAGENSDECGIVAAGLGVDDHGYVLADRSGVFTADVWAHRSVSLFDDMDADRIIAEVNNGGDLVESVIRTVRHNIAYEKVHASRGKVSRAEPVAALYEQGKVHHVGGFPQLEDELTNFVPGALAKSPNRADALVWALTWLMCGKKPKQGRAVFL